jgi:hypothetical protein
MARRMLEQHRDEALGCIEVAGEQRHRARFGGSVTKQQCVIEPDRFLDIGFHHVHRLIGIPLQPQDGRQCDLGRHALVELKPDDVCAAFGAT